MINAARHRKRRPSQLRQSHLQPRAFHTYILVSVRAERSKYTALSSRSVRHLLANHNPFSSPESGRLIASSDLFRAINQPHTRTVGRRRPAIDRANHGPEQSASKPASYANSEPLHWHVRPCFLIHRRPHRLTHASTLALHSAVCTSRPMRGKAPDEWLRQPGRSH